MSDDKTTSPFCILLPICLESKDDYFLSILRSIIDRAKIENNLLDSAVKKGMMLQTFQIEADDLDRWEDPKSTQQNIKRAMMIGFWAIENFPSLGRKICGDGWNAPQRVNIEVNGQGSITPNEFDAHIFAKLEIRVIELRLCPGTLNRFKCFTKAPPNLKKVNKVELTKKVVSYNVANGLDHQCWDALRSGVFTISDNDDNTEASTRSPEHPTNSNTDSHSEIERFHVAKRRRQNHFTEGDATAHIIDQITNESCRLASSNDIGIISEQIERDSDQVLHSLNLKRKDDAIDQLSKTVAELQKEIQLLKIDKVSLSVQVEGNAKLVDALQKGLEANLKLSAKYEAEIAVHKDLISTFEQTVATKDKEMDHLQSTVDSLQSQLNSSISDADRIVPEMKTMIEKLQHSISESQVKYIELETVFNEWKVYGTAKNGELEEEKCTVKKLASRIEELELNLKEKTAEKENLESILGEWKMYGTTKDKEVESYQMNVNRLEKDMTELTAKNERLQLMVDEWKGYGAKKDELLEEEKAKVGFLEKKLGSVDEKISSIMPVMKKKIEELEQDLNAEIEKCGALEVKLKELHIYADTMAKELKEAEMLIVSLTDQINSMNHAEISGRNDETNEYASNHTPINTSTFLETQHHVESEVTDMIIRTTTEQEQNMTINDNVTDNEGNVSLPEVASADDTVNAVNAVQGSDLRHGIEVFETDDPVVRLCRPILLEQRFGWMKFNQTKNCQPWPGFMYGADDDGKLRAQRITSSGYVSTKKFDIFEYNENIPKKQKGQAALAALKKFNETFKLNFN